MAITSSKVTILEAENLVDKAQQAIEQILVGLAEDTGLNIAGVEIQPWTHEGRDTFTVRIHACLPISKG
jgi:hypothetical protein